jgi:CubicO group peptidase (beta-lactamase class C family)
MTGTPAITLDTDRIDALFAQWDSDATPGASLAIVHAGEIVYQRGYGMSNLEHGVPITPASIFHVASISKQFTDMCIAMLAVEGRLGLDDDLRRYVPEIPDYGPTITIRHLIHHTSGLRDQWDLLSLAGWRDDVDLITEGDVLWIAGRQRALNFAPGEQHLYCNTAYTLLAVIIKRVTGQSLREFAHERIFVPLGMSSTHFHDDHAEIVPGRTQAYVPGPDGQGYKISVPVFDVAGTTSLFTISGDLARWANNFDDMRVGGPEVFALTLTRGTLNDGRQLDYAFGLSYRDYRGVGLIEHGGADAGYRAHFLRVPAGQLAVIVLSNYALSFPQTLSEGILDICLADRLQPAPHAGVSPTVEQTNARAGLYRSTLGGDFLRLEVDGSTLTVDFVGSPWPFVPLDDQRYQLKDFSTAILTFDPAMPDSLTFGGSQPTRYERVELAHPSAADLAAYVGDYASDELDTLYTIAVEGDQLLVRRKKHDEARLRPATRDAFLAGDLRIEFTRDSSGQVDGFALSTSRSRGIAFSRA